MALFTADEVLPEDFGRGTFVGRVWRPDVAGPSVVRLDPDGVVDVTASWPTVRDLIEEPDPAAAIRAASGERIADLGECLAATAAGRGSAARLTQQVIESAARKILARNEAAAPEPPGGKPRPRSRRKP